MNNTQPTIIDEQDFVLFNTHQDEQEAVEEVLSYRGYTQSQQFQFSTEKEFV